MDTKTPPYPDNVFPWNVWEPMRDPITHECTCFYCKTARQEREAQKQSFIKKILNIIVNWIT